MILDKFLHYTWWFAVAYPVAGLIILFVIGYSQETKKSLIKIIEVINIVFGLWLLFILISFLCETKRTSGHFIYDISDFSEWSFYVTLFVTIVLMCFKKLRRRPLSILFFSFILFLGMFFTMISFKLNPGI